MYSLFLDTHDKNVIIILFKDGKIVDEVNVESPNKHSQIVMPSLKGLLDKNALNVHHLNEILVVNGPGSFTGERIAVTIAKTLAFTLNIPIKTIDSLKVIAINVDDEKKNVIIRDNKGAFVGIFDKNNNAQEEYVYMSKTSLDDFISNYKVYEDIQIDYEKVYEVMQKIEPTKAHDVKPLYVKGISALNDK